MSRDMAEDNRTTEATTRRSFRVVGLYRDWVIQAIQSDVPYAAS